jgi:hypothetical protein
VSFRRLGYEADWPRVVRGTEGTREPYGMNQLEMYPKPEDGPDPGEHSVLPGAQGRGWLGATTADELEHCATFRIEL